MSCDSNNLGTLEIFSDIQVIVERKSITSLRIETQEENGEKSVFSFTYK